MGPDPSTELQAEHSLISKTRFRHEANLELFANFIVIARHGTEGFDTPRISDVANL